MTELLLNQVDTLGDQWFSGKLQGFATDRIEKGVYMYGITREIDFCYGHRLLNYDGKCRHLHGHNGRAIITIAADTLDDRGMVFDFSDVKKAVATWIDKNLDHRMLLCKDDPVVPILEELGEPMFLMDTNPTAENIAKLIYEVTANHGFPIVEASLWETPKCYATFRG